MQALVESSLDDLTSMGFIHRDEAGTYQATQLGKAVVASSLEPEDGAFVHRELQRALRAFVMDGEMHILYTFTPVQDFAVNVNWRVFRNEVEDLDDSAHRVMSFLVSNSAMSILPLFSRAPPARALTLLYYWSSDRGSSGICPGACFQKSH